MIIDLPEELMRFVQDQVRAGRYKTDAEVICDALEQLRRSLQGSLRTMREAAGELDEIVEHAMKRREQRWGSLPGE
jgi:putative addiction module CopG family antidote